MGRLRHEHGFTLVELLVVTLVVAILAAIALPSFLSQRAKGQDSTAKSNARSLVTQMEACYTDHDRYDPCPEPNTGLPLGPGRGQVQSSASGDTYVLVAHSKSGNTFTIEKETDGSTVRSCVAGGVVAGGCNGGSW